MTTINLHIGMFDPVADAENGVADLYIGLEPPPISGGELILTSPYAEPSPYLLVLRSTADIEPIDGVLTVTEAPDFVVADAQSGFPPEPPPGGGGGGGGGGSDPGGGGGGGSGNTLTAISADDTASLTGSFADPIPDPVTGTLAITESADQPLVDGQVKLPPEIGVGHFAVTEAADQASFSGATVTVSIAGTLAITDGADTATFTGLGYTGIPERVGALAATDLADTAAGTATFTMKWRATMAASEQTDVVSFGGAFLPYTGPGFLNVTGRSDTAVASGRVIYDVAATMTATDAADTAAVVARIREVVIAETTDVVIVTESLIGDIENNLFDRVWATDQLDYSRDMAFADQAVASDELASQLRISLVLTGDTVIASESIQTVYDAVTADQVVATCLLQSDRAFDGDDLVIATDDLGSYLSTSAALADSATITDAESAGIFAVFADQVAVSDGLVGSLYYGAAWADTVIATDPALGGLRVTQQATDTALLTDSLASLRVAAIADTVTATETVLPQLFKATAVADTVTATDALTSALAVYAPQLTDTVTATDALLGGLTLVGVLADTVIAGDVLQTAEAQTVLVVNAETGAVSTYQFTPAMTGMAEYQGVLYLSGPDGLYALDAASDGDGDIVWTLRTGFSNLGTDRLKRVQDCNFQARTEGDTTFQVVSDRYGQKQEWNYRLPPLTRDSYRDGVVKVGKGIQSVYWQFAAEGIGPAEIDQLRLVVEPLSRRR